MALHGRVERYGSGRGRCARLEKGRAPLGAGLFRLSDWLGSPAGYETGTVSWSERVESSKRLIVAVVNATSVTVAVHLGFGHDPAGAVGAFVVTVYGLWPFLGVENGPEDPAAVKLKL
jgi:hypothetical protein